MSCVASSLQLPVFGAGQDDIVWTEGIYFVTPASSIITATYQLRVTSLDTVSGIQIQAADSDFGNPAAWNIQNQDSTTLGYVGGGPGFSLQFPFQITHGAGTMSPRAFRTRTYHTVAGETEYSRWLYFISGKPSLSLTVTPQAVDELLHSQTFELFSPDAGIWASFGGRGSLFHEEHHENIGVPIFVTVFQHLDVNSVWRTPYNFSPRNREHIAFIDENGDTYDFFLYSREMSSANGTAPIFPPPVSVGLGQNPISPLTNPPCFFVCTDDITALAIAPTDLFATSVDYMCTDALQHIIPGDQCIPVGVLEHEFWVIGDGKLLGGIVIG